MRNKAIAEVADYANTVGKLVDIERPFGPHYNDKLANGRRSVKFQNLLSWAQAEHVAAAITARFGYNTTTVQLFSPIGNKMDYWMVRFYM
ncbi:MAG TPA: hypothetical protein V6C65_13940 [Allocoleopsis sp.]